MVPRIFHLSWGTGCGDPKIWRPNWLGIICSGGPNVWRPNLMGTICPGGSILWGLIVQGNEWLEVGGSSGFGTKCVAAKRFFNYLVIIVRDHSYITSSHLGLIMNHCSGPWANTLATALTKELVQKRNIWFIQR